MTQVSTIIAALGGVRAAARALGVPPSTVQSWKRVNAIPHWRQAAVDAKLAELSQ